MGQFINVYDEKHRFIDLLYFNNPNAVVQDDVFQFSVYRQAQYDNHNLHENPYYNLELLCKAQDMAEDYGFNLILEGTLTDLIDTRQLEFQLEDESA